MKPFILITALALSSFQIHAEVRSDSEFLPLYQEATDFFKQGGVTVDAGVYLAATPSDVAQRRDLLNLLGGAKWDNPFANKNPITVGYAPGTVANTRNELWAQYEGNFFLLRDQAGNDQRIALGIPKTLIPADNGVYFMTPKDGGGVAYVALPRQTRTKVSPFARIPKVSLFNRYSLSSNSKNLIYFSKDGAAQGSLKVVLLKTDGQFEILTEISANAKLEPEVSLLPGSLVFKSGTNELSLLTLDLDGKATGAARKIFTARSGETIIFKDNTPLLQANRASGGRAFFYIRNDGSLSEVSVSRVSQTRITPEEHRVLNTYGADWARRNELGNFEDIIPRNQEVERILSGLKAQNNTWVNILGADGVGKTELLKLVAKRIAVESRGAGDWNGYSVYHIPMAAFVTLKAVELPKGTDPAEHPLVKLKGAISSKQVVVLMDDFLDDPALGPTNAAKAMDTFLELFRSEIENGRLRIVTTANSQVWSKVADANPQFSRMMTAITLQEPTRELLRSILTLQIKKLEKTFRISYDPGVIEIIQASAGDLYPSLSEPKRSVKAAEDLARSLGTSNPSSTVKNISVQEARSFFLRDVFSSKVLEGLDPDALRATLKSKVFGQDEALDRIVDELSALSLGVVDHEKPLAKLLLIGSTGTGKTYSSEILAESLGLPRVKIDMNFFNGFAADSPQTREIKGLAQRPFVLILDDIDKAGSKSVLAELRAVFDYGIYAQGTPNELNLRNAIIIMTANYGAQVLLNNGGDSYEQLIAKIQAALATGDANKQPEIPPHIWSRIESSIVIFRTLEAGTLTNIAKTFVAQTDKDIFDRFKINVIVDDAFIENIVSKSVQRELGAVPVQDMLRNKLRTQVSLHLSNLRTKEPARFAKVREVFVTVTGADSMRLIDNTDPRYDRLRRGNP